MNNINNNIAKDLNINYIISEFEIKEENKNKDIRIINSYENFYRENKWAIEDEYKNEKEIKENIEIRINDNIIPFSYYYNFKEKGKYIIKYIFKSIITKINHIFHGCNNLTNINLSNFNTQYVTDMSSMFDGCNNLANINLLNFRLKMLLICILCSKDVII